MKFAPLRDRSRLTIESRENYAVGSVLFLSRQIAAERAKAAALKAELAALRSAMADRLYAASEAHFEEVAS